MLKKKEGEEERSKQKEEGEKERERVFQRSEVRWCGRVWVREIIIKKCENVLF